MFVKHCKVEVYLLELKLCEHNDVEKMVARHFSKADTIGERSTCLPAHCEDPRWGKSSLHGSVIT